jgi:hypothetical protein
MFYDALESQRLLYHSADQQYIPRISHHEKRNDMYYWVWEAARFVDWEAACRL